MSTTNPQPRTSARSKLYERYDVEIQTTQVGTSNRKWLDEAPPPREIPLEERSNLELIVMIYKALHWRTKLLALLILISILSIGVRIAKRTKVQPLEVKERRWMDPDSHARCNPFNSESDCAMEGFLEIKMVPSGQRKNERQQHISQQELMQQEQIDQHHLPEEEEQEQSVQQQQQLQITKDQDQHDTS